MACTTSIGPGALNMVNAVAMAYAEQSPVLVVSGAPEALTRRRDALFHHLVKSYETQHRVYQEVTEASAVLNDPRTAACEIDRVLHTVTNLSRPGYLEMPRDMVNAAIDPNGLTAADVLEAAVQAQEESKSVREE